MLMWFMPSHFHKSNLCLLCWLGGCVKFIKIIMEGYLFINFLSPIDILWPIEES